jgi:hypothetical protein
VWSAKETESRRVKYWEIIADNLSESGWSWGCVATVDSNGRTIFVADAHRDDGKRFVAHADEKLTAFLELESSIRNKISHRWARASREGDSSHPVGRLTTCPQLFTCHLTVSAIQHFHSTTLNAAQR